MVHESTAWCLRDDHHVGAAFAGDEGLKLQAPLSNCVKCVKAAIDDEKTRAGEAIEAGPKALGIKNINAATAEERDSLQEHLDKPKALYRRYVDICKRSEGNRCQLPGAAGASGSNASGAAKRGIESPLISLIHGEDRRVAIRAFL